MMTQTTPLETWHDVNQRHLTAALARVKAALERHVNGEDTSVFGVNGYEPAGEDRIPPAALEQLCATFGLSAFERDVLLLCAGVELDSGFGPLCAAAQGDATRASPTFSLALAALPGAHWSALSPMAPLRYWHLVEVGTGNALTLSPLRIDERVLHYLAGVQHLDERLDGMVQSATVSEDALALTQQHVATRLAAVWQRSGEQDLLLPAIQLCGTDSAGKRAVAAFACAGLTLDLKVVNATALPVDPHELTRFIRLWEREAALSGSALLLDCHDLDPADSVRAAVVARLIERLRGVLIVSSPERRPDDGRPLVTFDVARPTLGEQSVAWRRALDGTAGQDETVEALVSQFDLSLPVIQSVCSSADSAGESTDILGQLWEASRVQARPRLEALARRLESTVNWTDLVLPEPQIRVLREVAVHVRRRAMVYERWGFASRYGRGLGISLLAAGPSGTGKTMAAQVLANDLRLDLYHIDLSQVVSKYIGETEKNLRRLFDAAEGNGAILLFDEADALFGKRSEVKDSHDRYANIEISYLLQRMEDFRGLAILTTNMKDALDTAFLRRLRFVVEFPFPEALQRAEIWRRVFPSSTPTNSLDFERLARLNLSGGSIRNVAMNAAFLAAEAGEAVGMKHLAAAARGEYLKLEKPLSEHEIGGWA